MIRTRTMICLAATTALAAPSLGQQSQQQGQQQNQQERNQPETQREQSNEMGTTARERQQQLNRERQRDRGDRQGQLDRRETIRGGRQLDWEETTIVGYDLNGDGRIDTYYAASEYDIERMRRQAERQRRSMSERDRRRMQQQQRMQRDRRMGDDRRMQRDRGPDRRAQRGQSQREFRTVEGTIRGTKSFDLTGLRDPRTVARVETQDGERVAVIMGKEGQMRDLDLRQGDRVELRVRRGSIDNRQVLVADRVRTQAGQTRRVSHSKVEDLKLISGEIVGKERRSLRSRSAQRQGRGQESQRQGRGSGMGDAQQHLIAMVQDETGRTCPVVLGPVSRRDEQRLRVGEEVTVLAAPTRINGKQAYKARKLSHDGETVTISPMDNPRRDRQRQMQQRDRQQQMQQDRQRMRDRQDRRQSSQRQSRR